MRGDWRRSRRPVLSEILTGADPDLDLAREDDSTTALPPVPLGHSHGGSTAGDGEREQEAPRPCAGRRRPAVRNLLPSPASSARMQDRAVVVTRVSGNEVDRIARLQSKPAHIPGRRAAGSRLRRGCARTNSRQCVNASTFGRSSTAGYIPTPEPAGDSSPRYGSGTLTIPSSRSAAPTPLPARALVGDANRLVPATGRAAPASATSSSVAGAAPAHRLQPSGGQLAAAREAQPGRRWPGQPLGLASEAARGRRSPECCGVWSLRLFSSAIVRSRDGGTHRPDAAISAMRSDCPRRQDGYPQAGVAREHLLGCEVVGDRRLERLDDDRPCAAEVASTTVSASSGRAGDRADRAAFTSGGRLVLRPGVAVHAVHRGRSTRPSQARPGARAVWPGTARPAVTAAELRRELPAHDAGCAPGPG